MRYAGMSHIVRQTVLLAPGLSWLAVFLVVPCAIVFGFSFFERGIYGGIEYVFGFDNYRRAVDPLYLGILLGSCRIAGIVTALALIVGYPAAYLIANAPTRRQRLLLVLVILPFWTNYLIRSYAWMVLLNSEGFINRALRALGLTTEPLPLLYNEGAIVLGLLYAYLPLMILPLYAALARMPRDLREASLDLGASSIGTFLRIVVPLSLPGAVVGAVFVFVPSIGNFITPDLLGGGRTNMMGTLIYDQFLSARDWPFGSALAFLLIALMAVLLMVQAWLVNRARTVGHA